MVFLARNHCRGDLSAYSYQLTQTCESRLMCMLTLYRAILEAGSRMEKGERNDQVDNLISVL